jgi:hypothetical protein
MLGAPPIWVFLQSYRTPVTNDRHRAFPTVQRRFWASNLPLQERRRIAEEGSSFRQLLSDARRELARVYLQHPSLGLSKTASLLGYEDSNSFLRAFRVWEGVTPSEWRAMQKAGLQETPGAFRQPPDSRPSAST